MQRKTPDRRREYAAVGAVVSALMAVAGPRAGAQQLAFPEAEGFGRYTTGGRGGDVYHVTNLNNSGTGSLRYGMDNAPSNGQGGKRTIVFDVGGVIKLTSLLVGQDNVTIAGQTAPGPGITVYSGNYAGEPTDYVGGRVSFSNANNSITRYLRIRHGSRAQDSDAMTIADGNHMVFDHLSVTWGRDETFSMNGSAAFITLQNSIVGQGLEPHSAGGLVQSDGGGISLLRNLYIDNNTRNVKANGIQQFTNNIVYNWGGTGGDGYIQGDTTAPSMVNAQGNFFINGKNTASSKEAFTRGTPQFLLYASDNWQDSDHDGNLEGHRLVQSEYGTGSRAVGWQTTPFDYPSVNVQSAQDAFAHVSKYVGTSLVRDSVDNFLVDELESKGKKGTSFRHEFDLDTGGFVLFDETPAQVNRPAAFDTDGDGMPNDWENAHGLNPNLNTDRNNVGITGYTRLEEYLNEIGGNHSDKVWQSVSGQWTEGAKWNSSGTPIFEDDTFVRAVNATTSGRVDVSGSASVSAFRLFIGGGTGPAAAEKVAVSGGTLRVQDTVNVGFERAGSLDISGGTVQAQNVILGYGPLASGLSTTPVFSGALTITGGTLSTTRLVSGGGTPTFALSNGTLQASADLIVSVPISLGAGVNTIDTNGNAATFSGAIGGSGALTKVGEGAADLTVASTYSGGTILKGGMLGIDADDRLGATTGTLTFQGGTLRINGTTLKNLNPARPFDPANFNGGFDIAAATNTFTVSQTLAGAGSLSKYGAGTLALTGPNAHTGGTFLYDGMTSVSADNNLGASGGAVTFAGGGLSVTGTAFTTLANHPLGGGTLNGTIEIVSAANVFAISQNLGGTGNLIKTGAGTLLLSGANSTRSGTTDINAGTVKIGTGLALRKSTVILDTVGGKLDVNGINATLGGLSGNQPLDLKGVNLFIGENDSSQTFSGVMSSSVGTGGYTKVGAGSFTPSGANTYTGNTTIGEGFLSVATVNAPGAAGPLGKSTDPNSLVLDGGTFKYTGAADLVTTRGFSLGPAGGSILAAATSGLTQFAPGAATKIGFVGTAGAHTLTLTGDKAGRNQINFIIADDPGGGTRGVGGPTTLVKDGSGQWTISTGNTLAYTGDTIIDDGTLETITSTNPLPNGVGKGDLFIAPGGTLNTHQQTININGLNDGTGGGGTIVAFSATQNKFFTLGNGDASGAFSGTIAFGNNKLTKVGTGTQILSGINSNTGTIAVNGGVLQFNSFASMGGITTQNMDVAQNATAAAGYAMDQAFLNRITSGSMGTAAVAVNSTNPLSFLTPNLSLARLGAVGNVTYSGTLTPHGTTFRLGGGGGTLGIPTVLSGATNNLQVYGGGTVSLTAANSFGGITTVGNGALLITNNLVNGIANSGIGSSPAVAANLVIDGGTLRYSGATTSTNRSFTLGALGGTIDASGTGTITFSAIGTPIAFSGTAGPHTLTLGGTNIGRNTFGLSVSDDTRAGNGKTTLAKIGAGMFVMSSASSYTGGTTISAGTLVAAINGSLGTGNVNIAAGAKLDLSTAGVTDGISNSSTLFVGGSGATAGKVDFQLKSFNEVVQLLNVNGAYLPAGTYNASNLSDYITGSGGITAAVPEPGLTSMMLVPALSLLRRRRRRQ